MASKHLQIAHNKSRVSQNSGGLKMHQTGLFHGEHLPLRIAYQQLFKHLPALPVHEDSRGRPQISRDALLRALVYRALRRFTTLSDLVHALNENPALLEAIGLDPLGPVPTVTLLRLAASN